MNCRIGFSVCAALALSSGAAGDTVFGLAGGASLVKFQSDSPANASAPLDVIGLADGETLLGIDFRPLNGLLYALGSSSRVYQIDTSTGQATGVGADPFSTLLDGKNFGFDFNPTVDRIRITSDSGQNLRFNPNDGLLASVDKALNFNVGDPNQNASPAIVASAYTNNFAGAPSTVLYDIDAALDILAIQSPPNDGVLTTVGALGFDAGFLAGFDIASSDGAALAALTADGGQTTSLYSIDLTSGTATLIGGIGAAGITDIAIAIPAPGAAGLLALVLLGGARRGR
jgi:hypothetical protein